MPSRIETLVIPIAILGISLRLLVFAFFDTPMEDNNDDLVEWMGSRPSHLAAPALSGIKNSLIQGDTLEVGRDNVTVRAINGLDRHANTSHKAILPVNVIPHGNSESRKSYLTEIG